MCTVVFCAQVTFFAFLSVHVGKAGLGHITTLSQLLKPDG